MERFLNDENVPVDPIEKRCLKPRGSLGTVMEDTLVYLLDIRIFKIQDVIDCPLELTFER